MPDMKQTIIEDGTELDGSINSRCPITVSGTVKGELLAPALTVTGSGSVDGQVKVETLRSEGCVSGEIDADCVELSGKVSDRTVISAQTLEVHPGQPGAGPSVTFGDCQLRVGQVARTGTAAKAVAKRQTEPEPAGEPVL